VIIHDIQIIVCQEKQKRPGMALYPGRQDLMFPQLLQAQVLEAQVLKGEHHMELPVQIVVVVNPLQKQQIDAHFQ
jgi:hypothetical protein